MNTNYCLKLNIFYKQQGIYPEDFHCRYHSLCRSKAYQRKMTETRMSMIGSIYGEKYPKIVVVSLDPPSDLNGKFSRPDLRITESVTALGEAWNYTIDRPNPHWAMTQIIVKDVLTIWGYKARPNAAVVAESYAGGRPIENVTPYFAHVNAAKCSMNNPGGGQAPQAVFEACSKAYLRQELAILEPQILISQGKITNNILAGIFKKQPIEEIDLPKVEVVALGQNEVFWLPMHHPSRQIKKIRDEWPYYENAIRKWAQVK
jgi:hypothetical protein